jgi:exopolysaccharide biosynthesis protein
MFLEEVMNNRVSKKELKQHGFLRFLIAFFSAIIIIFFSGIFLLYGPFIYFRDTIVTISMSTMNHQWIAKCFFDDGTIADVMERNKTIEPNGNTDPNAIRFVNDHVVDNAKNLPQSPEDGEHVIDGIGFLKIKGSTYNGWVVKVYDTSRVYMSLAQKIGKQGEKTTSMVKRLNAYIGINAGGFADIGGKGNGGMPTGYCINNGAIITKCYNHTIHNIVGLDYNNKLILGKYTNSEITNLKLKDAVEFKPFLIVNGTLSVMHGNGGMGTDPRTAIGQTKDGVIIFVIIDGRRVNSIGASLVDLQNIMLKYGAYNAANLDGGASSTLVFKNSIINTPSSSAGERYVPDAFLINHSAD